MKTKLFLLALLIAFCTTNSQAQNRTCVSAANSEISDNLDLRAVASIFGDSRNLQDFERRLNDPRLQISNLDLNYDNQVDYIRVIESVHRRTHVIILQSIIDYDLYQDIATIEVEKDRYNQVNIQVVGNNFIFGSNYIFEPVFYTTPRVYASFWLSTYRPYCSNWSWNYYPSYYYAWNPFPVYRYQNNINLCLNTYNDYNYVNYRRSNIAINIYNTRRCNGYEKLHPNHSFSRRNNDVKNRYELDSRRNNRGIGYRGETQKLAPNQRVENSRDYSQNRNDSQKGANPQRTESSREYNQNRNESQRVITPQRNESPRDYAQNRNEYQRTNTPQRTESLREYNQNRNDSPRGQSQRGQSSRFSQDEARNSNSREGNRRI